MSDSTKTVGTGGDYTTIQAWEIYADYDLASANVREIGTMFAEEFSAGAEIAHATTTSQYYEWLKPADGADFDVTDHSGARIVVSSSTTERLFYVFNDNFHLGGTENSSYTGCIGACLQTTNGGTVSCLIATTTGVDDTVCQQCICYEFESTSTFQAFFTSGSNWMYCYNCAVLGLTQSGQYGTSTGFRGATTNLACYNCIAIDIEGAYAGSSAYAYGFGAAVCYNCYAGRCTVVSAGTAKSFHGDCTGDYNAADDTYSSIFTNNLQSKSVVNQFVDDTLETFDPHLLSTSDLIDEGNDAYSIERDIDGVVSGDRDDIGVHEYTAGVLVPVLINHYKQVGAM